MFGRRHGPSAIAMAASLLAASLVAFLVIKAMPGDPVAIAIRAWNLPPTPEMEAAIRREWRLDEPVVAQYLDWLLRFVSGDWGVSYRTGEPVLQEILSRLPLSLTIGLGGLALAAVLAVPLGFEAALRPRGAFDRLARAVVVCSQAAPVFWIGLVALWVVGVKLRWISPSSYGAGTIGLAIALIGFSSLGPLSRVYRRDLVSVADAPFFRTAMMKGLSRRQALWRHGHRHALFALLSAVRAEAGWAIGGGATLEVLFGLPGISQFLIQAIGVRDYFVLQAYIMVVASWMLLMNAGVSVTLSRLDPRVD